MKSVCVCVCAWMDWWGRIKSNRNCIQYSIEPWRIKFISNRFSLDVILFSPTDYPLLRKYICTGDCFWNTLNDWEWGRRSITVWMNLSGPKCMLNLDLIWNSRYIEHQTKSYFIWNNNWKTHGFQCKKTNAGNVTTSAKQFDEKKKQNSKRTFDELTRHTEAHWKQLKVFQSDNRFKNYNWNCMCVFLNVNSSMEAAATLTTYSLN